VVIRRRLAVPLRHVCLAPAEARHIRHRFGPEGWPVTHCEMGFRAAGTWRMVMTGPDGKGGAMNPARRGQIVFTHDFEADGEATEVTLTLEFASVAMKKEYLGIGMREGLASRHDQWQAVARHLARG
jgi:uncharacterized protein YndB with AHSA1/START domain